MAIELTPEQVAAISGEHGPIQVDGLEEPYILISEEMFKRLVSAVDFGEPSEQERLAQLQEFGKLAGWDDPAMDLYEDYRPK